MNTKALALDAVLVVFACALMFPSATGYALHEWAGIVFPVALLIHVAARHAEGMRLISGGIRKHRIGKIVSFVLNAVLFIDLAICTVSGLMVSGAVLPFVGMYAGGFFFWAPVHAFTAQLFVALALVHVVLFAPKLKAMMARR